MDKRILWGFGLIGGIYVISKLAKVAAVPSNILVDLSYGWEGLSLVVNANIKNPVGQSVTITKPFVTIKSAGNVVGSTDPSAELVQIPANGSVKIPIKIGFNLVQLALTSPDFYNAIVKKQPLTLEIKLVSGLQTPIGIQEFGKTETKTFTSPI